MICANKSGFTLVELLVVIALIAALGAILFPVFANARSRSRIAGCTANLRQIGQAVAMYKSDYDGTYPQGIDGYNRPHDDPNELGIIDPFLSSLPDIIEQLETYTKSKAVFRCPSDEGEGQKVPVYERFGTSYHFVMLTGGETDECWESPAELYYTADFSGTFHTSPKASIWSRKSTFLLLDGHVKFVNDLDNDFKPALGRAWGMCKGQ